ncbi:MAG: hypothetical protein KFF50_00790 [Desulfatitalea sp.]|nr:hypothetical protein [Desulfatitalea sp.]
MQVDEKKKSARIKLAILVLFLAAAIYLVRFWEYFAGTALGIMVDTFIFTFFISRALEMNPEA